MVLRRYGTQRPLPSTFATGYMYFPRPWFYLFTIVGIDVGEKENSEVHLALIIVFEFRDGE